MDGHEVLKEIKGDTQFQDIPVIMLTTSNSQRDVTQAYCLGAKAFVVKPLELNRFDTLVKAMETF